METKLRKDIPDEFKWDLTHLYKTNEDFENDIKKVEEQIKQISDIQTLIIPCHLKDCLDLESDITKTLYKLLVYVCRYFDQEQNNEDADKMKQRCVDLYDNFKASTAYITDTIIHFSDEHINTLLKQKLLKDYHFDIKEIVRLKEHYLSKVEEELLAKIADVFSTSSDIYTVFKNTEMKYSEITKTDGEIVLVNDQNYRILRESNVRDDRKLAYNSFWTTYSDYKNTFTKLIYKAIKSTVTNNRIRKFNSSIEASLSNNNIPVVIYDRLIENMNNNLDKFYDYLRFRKEILGLDDMNYYDINNPIVKDVDFKFSYDEAKRLVIESTRVLGEEYTEIMETALNNSWVDVYPNQFKETGAYMDGIAYDEHPYILMNYNEIYHDVLL